VKLWHYSTTLPC